MSANCPKPHFYKDLTRLTTIIKWVLYAFAAAAMVSLFFNILELQLLSDIKNQAPVSQRTLLETVTNNERRRFYAVIIYMLIFLLSTILIARWIYLANKNAAVLSGHPLEFTPGWAVGWYFIPIANLWKPYQAMKEIWQTSFGLVGTNPVSTSLLNWWWFLWLASTVVGRIALRHTSLNPTTIGEFNSIALVSICGDTIRIVISFVLLSIIAQIHLVQRQAYEQGLKQQLQSHTPNPF